MNLRFTQLTLGPIGWVLVVGAGLVLGYGLSNVGIFLPLALAIGVLGVLGTLLILDRRAAKRLTQPRRRRTRSRRTR
jgi:uncharacterized iron-regulated membrane protein